MPFNNARQSMLRLDGRRSSVFAVIRLSLFLICHAVMGSAHPLEGLSNISFKSQAEAALPADDPQMWILLGTSLALVLLGGVFAGLTIALMGQDEIYLQVIATSGDGSERKNATKVLQLLKRGKHWVLVTLLVSNVITNETLPLVLDRALGGGYAAAITSTVLVIIFGEIVPQSACVRYGLPIGAWTSPLVLAAMWITCPVSWPVAKLLDYILGEDHGTTYKKAGLKTLVTLHKTLGGAPGERLNEDEVLIISSVLDLKAKAVGSIMTPMNDVFTLSADAILDEDLVNDIMREGYSRIPIHSPKNEHDFVGMLLVKILITYDPEDCRRVGDFSLATLPESLPDTSCLDILNFFQQGQSHMVLVSDNPGGSYGALGVVTLEDVIEELIGEEIIDESDVFVNIHKALRRMAPAPMQIMRSPHHGQLKEAGQSGLGHDHELSEEDASKLAIYDDHPDHSDSSQIQQLSQANGVGTGTGKRQTTLVFETKPKPAKFLMRRKSSGGEPRAVQLGYGTAEMKENLKNLGPSNVASHPRPSRFSSIKIKPGVNGVTDGSSIRTSSPSGPRGSISTPPPTSAQDGIGKNLISADHKAADGVHAVQTGYGTWDQGPPWKPREGSTERRPKSSTSAYSRKSQSLKSPQSKSSERGAADEETIRERRSDSASTLASLQEGSFSPSRDGSGKKSLVARSGSIQEKYIKSGSVKKLVLELTSSSEETEGGPVANTKMHSRTNSRGTSQRRVTMDGAAENGDESTGTSTANGRKKRKKRSKRKQNRHNQLHDDGGESSNKGTGDEATPLLKKNSGA